MTKTMKIYISECNANKIQPLITAIQFIKYSQKKENVKIQIIDEEFIFDIPVKPDFIRTTTYHIAEIINKLNGKECVEIGEGKE